LTEDLKSLETMNNISQDYKKQIELLHSKNKMGKNSKRKVPKLFNMPDFLEKYNPASILDYGCGSGGVVNYLSEKFNIVEGYDPCVE
jgi:2-polyprenyl-3-methyl-5-hydroxy-6-metoxy-1,4-benzoquinol methylase